MIIFMSDIDQRSAEFLSGIWLV